MVKTSYELNEEVSTQPFPSVRGEREVEVEMVSYAVEKIEDTDDPIGITNQKYLGDFITKFGLTRHFDEFPRGWGLVEENAREMPGVFAYVNRIDEGRYSGISLYAMYAAIQILYDGSKSYYGQDLTLWSPNKPLDDSDAPGSGPWVLESEQVPEDWIVHGEFDGEDDFSEHVEKADPDREQVIAWLREEIDSVLLLIAPNFPDPDQVQKIEDEDQRSMDELIGEYKAETGDEYLQDEDALDSFLEARDAL